jgi:large subunit ribosomal protein L22e|tara:strand:+ start:561 stop:941 length:381 start_codon:yes stop_codon:yes gene_type:complete
MPKSKKSSGSTEKKKFCIDCKVPFQDNVLDPASFMKFLTDRIKVDGRTGNLGTKVEVKRESEESPKIYITAQLPFSKRYLKYLTKKYLKQQDLRDYLHVIASNASTYELKYFNITDGGEMGGDDDE